MDTRAHTHPSSPATIPQPVIAASQEQAAEAVCPSYAPPVGHPEHPYWTGEKVERRSLTRLDRRTGRPPRPEVDRRRPSYRCLVLRQWWLAERLRERFGDAIAEEAAERACDCGRRAIGTGRAARLRNRAGWLLYLAVLYAVRLARRAPAPDCRFGDALALRGPWSAADDLIRQETLAAVESAMVQLPPLYAAAVRLRLVNRMRYADLAAMLGCSDVTARQRVRRGMLMLTELLVGR